jgi:nucleotide-binding universal stress UspA family protein
MPLDERESAPRAPGEAAPAAGPAALPPGAEGEAAAWAEVLERWDDETAHRAYLDRFPDLEGLAIAGGRYRAVLAEFPGEPIALRRRDEIVKRATVAGIALLPRTRPPRGAPRWLKIAVVAAAIGAALVLAAVTAVRLLTTYREITP